MDITNEEDREFARKIAVRLRMFGTDVENEAMNAWRMLKKLLATKRVTFTELGDAVEKLPTGGLKKPTMERLFKEGHAKGYAEGVADTKREHVKMLAKIGRSPDYSHNFETIAQYCHQERMRADPKSHEFLDDVAMRMTYGRRSLTINQQGYLLSIFHKLGGRVE
jgi:hypothetical protein